MPIEVDASGVTVPTIDESIEDLLGQFAAIFGAEITTAAQTPQAQIAGLIAAAETEIGERVAAVAAATSPYSAAGIQLDVLGEQHYIPRIGATYSTVDVTLTGTAGTNVPAGSRAKTTGGDTFETVADATLSTAGVTVEMRAVEPGPVAIAAATLTSIVTVIAGWETVTNPTAGIEGRAAQADAEYRVGLLTRPRRAQRGPLAAILAAIDSLPVGRRNGRENRTAAALVVQQFTIAVHGVLIVAEKATDAEVTRAVENHRGLGAPTMTAIVGGTPDNSTLDAVTDGTVTFAGVAYTGLDLSSAPTGAAKAAALTTLLANAGVVVAFIDNVYIAQFGWQPDADQQFAAGSVETAFGLNPDDAVAAPGPFLRPRNRPLTVTLDVTRLAGFPADGLAQIRTALTTRVAAYDLGATVYLNDLLAVAQAVTGAQVTSMTVQHSSADVNGTAPPLDSLWTLPTANITVTIT